VEVQGVDITTKNTLPGALAQQASHDFNDRVKAGKTLGWRPGDSSPVRIPVYRSGCLVVRGATGTAGTSSSEMMGTGLAGIA
jgi:hypothetical protein